MKCLTIQIQPDADTAHSAAQVIELAKTLGRYPEIDHIKEDGGYTNLNFFTEELPLLWSELKPGLLDNPELGPWIKASTIIVCEGDKGWDNYLLLSHFDDSEQLDTLPQPEKKTEKNDD